MKYNRGSRVECIVSSFVILKGYKGTVVSDEEHNWCNVYWDNDVGGWGDFSLGIPEGHGWTIEANNIKLISEDNKLKSCFYCDGGEDSYLYNSSYRKRLYITFSWLDRR